MIRARVITCSDSVAAGTRDDRSGPAVRDALVEQGYAVDAIVVVPDDIAAIANAIQEAATRVRLIVTTGGTGIAKRDVTPEAVDQIRDRLIPGFGERMRATHPKAALSRAQAATMGTALILNLPGSTRGAVENLAAVLDLVPHALELLAGKTGHE